MTPLTAKITSWVRSNMYSLLWMFRLCTEALPLICVLPANPQKIEPTSGLEPLACSSYEKESAGFGVLMVVSKSLR